MKYRQLGKTKLSISEIGFGAWAIGGNSHGNSYGPTDDNESLKALRKSLEKGCNFFDTADVYGYGHSEELLGKIISETDRSSLIIATKVGGDFYSGRTRMNFSSQYIKFAVNKSLQRLNSDYIDLYQLHNPSLDLIKKGEIFEVMRELKKEGKIRYFGISIHESIEGIEAMKHEGVDTLQVVFNIFDYEPSDDLFPIAKKENVGIIAREPLANSLLTGKYNSGSYFPPGDIRHGWPTSFIRLRTDAAKSLKPLLTDEIDSLAKLSLKFDLSNKTVSTVIPGCKNIIQTDENFSVSTLRNLTKDELINLKELQLKHFNV